MGTSVAEQTKVDMITPLSCFGAILRGSPSERKTHAGKYGELTPLRQRGGGGDGLPLTQSVNRRLLC